MGAFSPGNNAASSSGGSYVPVESHAAANSAQLAFTTGITATYDIYVLELIDILCGAATSLYLQCSTNGGASYDGLANYQWSMFIFSSAGSVQSGSPNDSHIQLYPYPSRTTTFAFSGSLKIVNPLSGAPTPFHGDFLGGGDSVTSDRSQMGIVGGAYTVAAPINAFRLIANTGNLTSGIARLYGIGH